MTGLKHIIRSEAFEGKTGHSLCKSRKGDVKTNLYNKSRYIYLVLP